MFFQQLSQTMSDPCVSERLYSTVAPERRGVELNKFLRYRTSFLTIVSSYTDICVATTTTTTTISNAIINATSSAISSAINRGISCGMISIVGILRLLLLPLYAHTHIYIYIYEQLISLYIYSTFGLPSGQNSIYGLTLLTAHNLTPVLLHSEGVSRIDFQNFRTYGKI